MKKASKKLIACLAVTCLAAILAGCSDHSEEIASNCYLIGYGDAIIDVLQVVKREVPPYSLDSLSKESYIEFMTELKLEPDTLAWKKKMGIEN